MKDIKKTTPGAVLQDGAMIGEKNPWGQAVLGWIVSKWNELIRFNPRGFALLWVALHNEKGQLLYNQPILPENAGAIVIAEYEGKVCLVRNFRMTGPRIMRSSNYIQDLEKQGRWKELVQSLGEYSWESPRGIAPSEDTQEELSDLIIRTAKLEALEESGLVVENAKIVGAVNSNKTFFPHSQTVVHAKVVSVSEAVPENLELISGKQFFSMKELRDLINEGKFDDGLTLSALALCGMCIPLD